MCMCVHPLLLYVLTNCRLYFLILLSYMPEAAVRGNSLDDTICQHLYVISSLQDMRHA